VLKNFNILKILLTVFCSLAALYLVSITASSAIVLSGILLFIYTILIILKTLLGLINYDDNLISKESEQAFIKKYGDIKVKLLDSLNDLIVRAAKKELDTKSEMMDVKVGSSTQVKTTPLPSNGS
jgi:hypothetical protein